MTTHEVPSGIDFFNRIADGSIGKVEVDKGGNYSPEHHIWVDQSLPLYIARLSPEDRRAVELMGGGRTSCWENL